MALEGTLDFQPGLLTSPRIEKVQKTVEEGVKAEDIRERAAFAVHRDSITHSLWEIQQKKDRTETDERKLDFLEKYAMSRLSSEELIRTGNTDEAEKILSINWKDGIKAENFEELWQTFKESKNYWDVRNNLDILSEYWNVNADNFPDVVDSR